MTDQQYFAWLADQNALRVVLIEVGVLTGGTEQTRYLADRAYTTGDGDTPAHTPYLPRVVKQDVVTNEALSTSSDATMTLGEVSLFNGDRALDSWLLDIWTNRALRIYLGDARWARGDFRLVFDGLVAEVSSKSRDKISFKVRDKLQALNAAVSEAKLGGTGTNKDSTLPLTFGEVFNIEPLMIDQATLTYQYHIGASEEVIEVRDDGIPVSITPDAANGKFKLNQSPAGNITADVQGDKSSGAYVNTVAKIVQVLTTGYGPATTRFTVGDLDATNLAAFDTAYPQPVGLHLADRTNVIEACKQVADSVGAQMTVSRLGKLRLFQVDLSNLTPAFDIYPKHMVEHDLHLADTMPVSGAVKLGFCLNNSVQTDLKTSITALDKQDYALDYLTETVTDATTIANHRLTGDPVQENSLLLRRTDANAEALRRLALRKVARRLYQFDAFSELLQLELGQHVRLHHPNFNLGAGVAGMVVSLSAKWSLGRVTVGVLI